MHTNKPSAALPPWARIEVFDISHWHVIQGEPGGKDPNKVWVSKDEHSTREDWWLWKPQLTTNGADTVPRLNDMAEVVSSRLAEKIDLPAARCEIAVRNGQPGSISRSIAPHPMNLSSGDMWVAENVLPEVSELLNGLRGHGKCSDMTAFEVFAGYLVLDAWIANTDRHGGNWGVLHPGSINSCDVLAPAFDHGAALGSGLPDSRRAPHMVKSFCDRGKSRSFRKQPLLDLARDAVEMSGATWWVDRVAAVPPAFWQGIVTSIDGVSEVASSFTIDVLATNQERVSGLCRP